MMIFINTQMLLSNINIVGEEGIKHIRISNGKITNITQDEKLISATESIRFNFTNAYAFPGLINSHDHLEFNLFPQLGHKTYNNYTAWGTHIHQEYKEQINEILKIPESVRIRWGVYKNLLSGITTVVNHGKKILDDNSLINIFQQCRVIHSVHGEKNWRINLNKIYKRKQPVVIHIGEGIDNAMHREVDSLIHWNFFNRELIGIHGVAMNAKQALSFKALVWCPASNYFLFGKTAPIDILKNKTRILFGTDSTLTASWNIWDQLRFARDKGMVTDNELFEMLTIKASEVWKIKNTGKLAENQWADIVIAKPCTHVNSWDAFYSINPENLLLVIHRGNIRLFDAELLAQIHENKIALTNFSKIYLQGSCKYVQGDLPGLIHEIRKYCSHMNFPVTSD